MDDYDKRKLKDCVFNIEDKIFAIANEISNKQPYKGYILEKAKPILNDIQVIISMCEK